jgi:3-oxoacyl-[acyl-carrier protein] reductase
MKKKVVIITGGSRGIGLEIAKAFNQKNYTTIIISKNPNQLYQNSILKKRALYFSCDLSIEKDVIKILKIIKKKFSKIDTLICNAGKSNYPIIKKTTSEDFLDAFKNNFLSTSNIINNYIKIFFKLKNTKIICISSAVTNFISDAPIPYSVSKAALNFYIKNMIKKLSKLGILINVILPGNIFTKNGNWDLKLKKAPIKVKNMIQKNIPLKKLGNAKQISEIILFLCQKKSSFTTGSFINIDGGQSYGK